MKRSSNSETEPTDTESNYEDSDYHHVQEKYARTREEVGRLCVFVSTTIADHHDYVNARRMLVCLDTDSVKRDLIQEARQGFSPTNNHTYRFFNLYSFLGRKKFASNSGPCWTRIVRTLNPWAVSTLLSSGTPAEQQLHRFETDATSPREGISSDSKSSISVLTCST